MEILLISGTVSEISRMFQGQAEGGHGHPMSAMFANKGLRCMHDYKGETFTIIWRNSHQESLF